MLLDGALIEFMTTLTEVRYGDCTRTPTRREGDGPLSLLRKGLEGAGVKYGFAQD